jgi:type I restriction enzyme S subunit
MKTYDKYKSSGIDWIGDIPEHWQLVQFKRLAKRIEVGIAEAATHAYTQEGVPILRATNIKKGKIEGNLLFINKEFADKNKSKTIFHNDLVTVRTGNAGLTSVVPKHLDGCQCFTMLITTLDQCNPHYYNYLFNSNYGETYFAINAWGTAQKNISVPILQELPVPKISLEEQTAIADYLDEKTTQIDKLIAEKRRLIELLKEERLGVINQAVTPGINPHAKLKPSGIAWLGDIPEHWEVKKLKYIASFRSGEGITSDAIRDEGEFPVYGGNGLRGYFSDFTHEGNFVLIGRQGALCGNVNYAFGKFWASEHAVVATLLNKHEVFWFGELLIARDKAVTSNKEAMERVREQTAANRQAAEIAIAQATKFSNEEQESEYDVDF